MNTFNIGDKVRAVKDCRNGSFKKGEIMTVEGIYHCALGLTGDSGKTAVINAEGMEALKVAYIDLNYCPFTNRSKNFKIYQNIIEGQ
jgi:hypothetical protein